MTSVIAPDGATPVSVLGAAYDIAVAAATRGALDRRSLFDLPLGEGPAWTLTEEAVQTAAPFGREEVHRVVLPAWSAESLHDLNRPELGIPAAAAAAKGRSRSRTHRTRRPSRQWPATPESALKRRPCRR